MLYCQSCDTDNDTSAHKCRECGCPYLIPYKSVLVRSDGKRVGIKSGFCWPAAIFGWMWTAYHRAWRLSLILAVTAFGLLALDHLFFSNTQNPLWSLLTIGAYASYMFICGKNGYALLEKDLQRVDYTALIKPQANVL
ncbi:DUF2628 domain-containing protein [Aquabacterium sp. A3]|uniref:DUF2628 domain-containing protein n=1 Tax=Aquabacterium sp. A3 TaxID=3132829 RepID=UPI00404A9870